VWTVRLPDDTLTVDPSGRIVTVDAHDVPVVDERSGPTDVVPATVSFQITWKGRGRLKHRESDAPAFVGDFFKRAVARGTFSASEDGFSFASDAAKPARSSFAMLGTEMNGVFLAARVCPSCESSGTDLR
jgi:hypothetical protein